MNRSLIAMKLADRILANSEAGLNAWGVSSNKGRVVYNGFDPARIPSTPRLGLTRTRFSVTMAGRMSSDKDFSTYIQAARYLSRGGADPSWLFRAIGTGPEREAIMRSAVDLTANGVIEFPIAGTEVMPYLLDSDVGVLMTNPAFRLEGCSNAIMEYMACGLPVVCSEGGGNRELVIDGQSGFIIRPLDVEALVDRLHWLQVNAGAASEMGKKGRRHILEHFRVEQMVRATTRIYEEILG